MMTTLTFNELTTRNTRTASQIYSRLTIKHQKDADDVVLMFVLLSDMLLINFAGDKIN